MVVVVVVVEVVVVIKIVVILKLTLALAYWSLLDALDEVILHNVLRRFTNF